MSVFLIIILTILVTANSSVDFHANRNKSAIKALGTTGRRVRAVNQLISYYPGLHLFVSLVALLATIWIACLAALTWGIVAGCFISLVIIALAQLLGARLIPLTDQLLIKQAGFINKYFGWTGVFNSLVTSKPVDPIDDVDELVQVLHDSKIDCPTQLLIERTLLAQHTPVEKLATKWSDIKKISFKDRLTPKHIDELFQSRQKIFPVIRNDENDVVGLLHLADVTVIGQSEKQLLSSMNRNFVSCETSTTTPEVLRLMADNETTVAIITKNKHIYGLVNLSEIISAGQSCQI